MEQSKHHCGLACAQELAVDRRGPGWHPRGGQGTGADAGTKGDSGRQETLHTYTRLAFKMGNLIEQWKTQEVWAGGGGYGGPEPKLSAGWLGWLGSQSIFFKITPDSAHTPGTSKTHKSIGWVWRWSQEIKGCLELSDLNGPSKTVEHGPAKRLATLL